MEDSAQKSGFWQIRSCLLNNDSFLISDINLPIQGNCCDHNLDAQRPMVSNLNSITETSDKKSAYLVYFDFHKPQLQNPVRDQLDISSAK